MRSRLSACPLFIDEKERIRRLALFDLNFKTGLCTPRVPRAAVVPICAPVPVKPCAWGGFAVHGWCRFPPFPTLQHRSRANGDRCGAGGGPAGPGCCVERCVNAPRAPAPSTKRG